MAIGTPYGRASDFIQSIGVNANPSDVDTLAEMQYLGIDNIRATDYDASDTADYMALGAAGMKFDLITVIAPQNPINLNAEMGYIDAVAPYVVSVEGPNEVNTDPVTYDGTTGEAAAVAFQKDLYAAVHSDSDLDGVKVLPYSLSVGGSFAGFGNVDAYADEGNVHGYASDGVPPTYMLSYAVSSVPTTTGLPVVMSETGNYTLADDSSGVTQDVQAKWMVDTLLENAKDGVARTYIYQLEDNTESSAVTSASDTNSEDHYGLFQTGDVAKEAATAIHDLTTILADPGAVSATFSPGVLDYTLEGMPQNTSDSMTFAKSDGSFDIAVWNEPRFYEASTGVTSPVAPSTVTVSLGGGNYDVGVYDVITGTAAIAVYDDVSSIQVSLATDPLVVQVAPAPAVQGLPAVTDITSTASSSPAHAGQLVDFVLAVNKPVSVDTAMGSPVLSLSDGGQATYQATESTTTSLAFSAVVAQGQSSTDLTVDELSLGGSAVTDVSGNALLASGLAAVEGSDTGLAVSGSAPATTLGSGPDSLVLGVSEDAYQGDATFTVSVDGTQVGGVQTASALHGAGNSQQYAILGSWGAGTHQVSVDFLNDLYEGTSSTDRNLYVDSASYAGVSASGAMTALLGGGTRTFSVGEASPILQVQTGDERLAGGVHFAFSFPADTFTDPEGSTLSYRVQQPNGTSLPSWLSFDPSTDTVSGTAPSSGATVPVVVVAARPDGTAAAEEFHVYVSSQAPILQTQAPDQRMDSGSAFSFAIPQNSYADPSGGSIGYTASQADDDALPSWLTFNPATGVFSGTTPSATSAVDVEVVATSSNGGRSAEAFHIYSSPPAPVLLKQASDEFIKAGAAFSFALPSGSYSSPDGSALSYKASQTDLTALPSWLGFNASQGTFSGIAPSSAGSSGTALGVRIDATTADGGAAAEAFHVYLR